MKAYQVWANPVTLDRRVVPILKLTSQQAGQVAVVGEFVGPPDELQSILAPLTEAVRPGKLFIKYVDYIDAVYFFGGVTPPHAPPGFEPLTGLLLPHPFSNGDHEMFKNTSAYQFDLFPDAAIDTLIDWLSKTPAASDLVQFDAYGVLERSRRSPGQYPLGVEGFRRAMLSWAKDGYVNSLSWHDVGVREGKKPPVAPQRGGLEGGLWVRDLVQPSGRTISKGLSKGTASLLCFRSQGAPDQATPYPVGTNLGPGRMQPKCPTL